MGDSAGPGQATDARVCRCASLDIDQSELSVVAVGVVLDHALQCNARRRALIEQAQPDALPGDVGVGLGGDRADPGYGLQQSGGVSLTRTEKGTGAWSVSPAAVDVWPHVKLKFAVNAMLALLLEKPLYL